MSYARNDNFAKSPGSKLWESDMENTSASSWASTNTIVSTDDIKPVDILCGRDKMSHAHSGNKRFRAMIEKHREEYQNARSRDTKTNITIRLVDHIRQQGGRFLKQDEKTGEWSDLGDSFAREKVSHALRSAKDPNRPKIKKRRVMPTYEPTAEEEECFQEMLSDQQRFYESLLEKESQGLLTPGMLADLNAS